MQEALGPALHRQAHFKADLLRDGAGYFAKGLRCRCRFHRLQVEDCRPTHGIDFETNYQGSLFGRPMALRLLAAYQPHIRYIQPAVPTIDQGGVAFGSTGITASPSWRLTGLMSFAPVEHLRVDMMYRWRNRLKVSGDSTVTFAAGEGTIDPYGQASLNLAWQPESAALSKAEFFLNIQNLFNANPPSANATGTNNAPGGFGGFATSDDPIGRYFTAGVRIKF